MLLRVVKLVSAPVKLIFSPFQVSAILLLGLSFCGQCLRKEIV